MSIFLLQAPTGIGQYKCRVNKAFITNHGLFLLWEKLKTGQLHPTFTGNCPWSRGQFTFITDPTASGFAYAWKARGAGGWGIPVFDPFSFTVYDQVQEDLNFPSNPSDKRPECLRKSTDNNQTFHFRALSPPCPFRFQSGLRSVSPILHFMNQLQNPPTSASSSCTQRRGPLVSLGSTRLLWFLTGVKWKCTVGAH